MKPAHSLLPILCILLFSNLLNAAENTIVYRTTTCKPEIASLRIRFKDSSKLERPVLRLNGEDVLEISFDELSHSLHQYSYTLLHLDADWRPSSLSSTDYLQGFPTQDIVDYEMSLNTQQLYTHYWFYFPNEDMLPTLSGNYAIVIYEDNDMDNRVATVCFSVVDPKAHTQVSLRGNTDIELNGRYQQLDIDLYTDGITWTQANDFLLVVQQNNRYDNIVYNPRPTYIEGNRLRYINRRELIFEGGNEYRYFDIASTYYMGNNVDHIYFDHTYYHAFLLPSENRADLSYTAQYDSNGQFVINAERTDYDDTEADYMWVHFFLPKDFPFPDGDVYVGGDLFFNQLSPSNKMQYDSEHRCYILSRYLKQGGYDFQYWFEPRYSQKVTTQPVEGSHYETQNEYTVYVYYRPFGALYDQLISVQRL